MRENAADRQPDAYESLAWKQMVSKVRHALFSLQEREQSIVRSHYFDGLDFQCIASLMGLSKGRISQLHKAAMIHLKDRLRAFSPFQTY